MNKKIVSILFAFVLCFCMVLPAFAVTDSTEINGFADEYSRVIDYAGVIPQQEEDKLVEQFDEIANRQKVDIVFALQTALTEREPRIMPKLFTRNIITATAKTRTV